jgi:hypothetical protein
VPWGREAAHVHPELGDDHLRGSPADPGDLIQPVGRLRERDDLGLDVGLHRGNVGAGLVDTRKHRGQQEPVMVAEAAGEGLDQLAALGAHAAPRQLGQHLGSRSPASSAASMARPDTPKLSLATTLSLIWASSSSLLHPLLFGSPAGNQVGAVAGQVPQPTDRRWRHEAWPQHLPLGDLGEPHRVQPVGLGSARQVLDIAGIHQPALEPVGLQQVKRGPPVVAGCLHHHPGHAQLPQPVGQHQQRAGHRGVGLDLLEPLAGLLGAWHPHAADQLGLADVQRRDPPDDLLGVVGLLQHPVPFLPQMATATATRGSHKTGRKLVHVLKATLKGPQRGSQRPTNPRPHQDQGATTSAGDQPDFTPERASPQGDRRLTRGAGTSTRFRKSTPASVRDSRSAGCKAAQRAGHHRRDTIGT